MEAMFGGLRESEDDMSAIQQKEHIKQTFSKAATVYSNNSKINNYEQNYCIILREETEKVSMESVETSNNLIVYLCYSILCNKHRSQAANYFKGTQA
jgi:hypothetical protein